MCRFLIDHGIDVDLTNKKGRRAPGEAKTSELQKFIYNYKPKEFEKSMKEEKEKEEENGVMVNKEMLKKFDEMKELIDGLTKKVEEEVQNRSLLQVKVECLEKKLEEQTEKFEKQAKLKEKIVKLLME